MGVVVERDAALEHRMILGLRLDRDHSARAAGQSRRQQRKVTFVRADVDKSHAGPQVTANDRVLGRFV